MGMKKLRAVFALLILVFIIQAAGANEPLRILYDDTHGQQAGNADWVINGGFSEFADTLVENGFQIDNLSAKSPNGTFSSRVLAGYRAVILPEPNDPYGQAERDALVKFVTDGGGLFMISSHSGADRNNNGWDAVKIFNQFSKEFGFSFNSDTFSEAPLTGTANRGHPVMFMVRGMGAWGAGTMKVEESTTAKVTVLQNSRHRRAPYLLASEVGKGRVVAIGDSSPFNDGVGSGDKSKLHDSYDSFMYSHPQLAYNTMMWLTGQKPVKSIPSREVALHSSANPMELKRNILIDAAHGNQSSDKMQTFNTYMSRLGFKVHYTLNLLSPKMLNNFSILIIPEPTMPFTKAETEAVCDWLMGGGRLFIAGSWNSSALGGRAYINSLLSRLGSVMRVNDDQVQDKQHNTNRPWGLLAKGINTNHPANQGVKTVITWGTASLVTRDYAPLTENSGVEIIVSANPTSFNKPGKTNFAVPYPEKHPIPLVASEKLANGILVLSGCSNFTDYQYPDSHINAAKPGTVEFTHETPQFFDNLMKYLGGLTPRGSLSTKRY